MPIVLMPIASLSVVLAAVAQAEPQAPPILRHYDLSTIAPATRHEAQWTLLPSLLAHLAESSNADWGEPDHDFAYTVLQYALVAEFDAAPGRFDGLGDGRVLVEAAPALQDALRRTVRSLEGVLDSRIELEVELWSGSAGSIESPPACIVPASQAADAVRKALGGAAVRTAGWTLRLRVGEAGRVEAVQELPLLSEHDVEIAQGSFIADPVVSFLRIGTQLHLAAAPVGKALALAVGLSHTEPIGPRRQRSIVLGGLLANEKGPQDMATSAVIETIDVRHGSLALNSLVPADSALVLCSDLALGRSVGRQVVLLKPVGPLPPVAAVVEPTSPRAHRTVLWNRAAHLPPQCASWWDAAGFDMTLRQASPLDNPLQVVVGMHSGDYDLLPQDLVANRLPGGEDAWNVVDSGSWCAFVEREHLSSSAPLNAMDALPAADMRGVEVGYRLLGPSGNVVVQGRLPLRPGLPSLALTGVESQLLADDDVEVAQFAATHDPQTISDFEGLMLQLTPRWNESGDLTLETVALARLRQGEARLLPVDGKGLVTLEQVDVWRTLAQEDLRFPRGQSGRAALGPGGQGLSLELEVRPLDQRM
jgi:hypothetical protein